MTHKPSTDKSIPELIQDFMNAVRNFNFGGPGGGDIKGYLSRLTAIKTTFESIGAIASSSKTIMDSLTEQRTTNPRAPAAARSLTGKITNALTDISTIIAAITNTQNNPLYDTQAQNKIKNLNDNLAKRRFADKLSSLANKFKTILNAAKEFGDAPADMDSQLSQKITTGLTIINTVISTLSANNLFTNINDRNNGLQKVARISGQLKDSRFKSKMTDLSDQITGIANGIVAVARSAINTGASINLEAVRRGFDIMFGQEESATSLVRLLEVYFGDDTTAGTPAARIENITNSIRGRLTTNIQEMVRAYNAFSTDLARLNTDVNVSLTRAGQGLGGQQTLRVQNAAVNAQINVQVNIEAKQLVSALEEQSRSTTTTNTPRLQTSSFVRASNTPGG